jgi:hypothetical protein
VRRVFAAMCAIVMLGVAAPSAAASSTWSSRNVDAPFAGTGGFHTGECSGIVTLFSDDTIRGGWLGHSTFTFHICIENFHPDEGSGAFSLTDASGSTLTGVISGGFASRVVVRLTRGTGRFAHARGRLVLRHIRLTDQTNCDPTHTICTDWKDHGVLEGTVRNVGS